ncbi:MAG: hypothetical protein Q7J73_09450 [Dehalococcoidales bacterium]|nr:hypothetical protein [Dehalococcoidales bacterium]
MTVDTCFEDAMSHPIVKAFVAKRSNSVFSGKTVVSESGERTLYHLGVGNDHRGATWHDASNGVVWLCGYGLHRSGQPLDAFQRFRRLLEQDRMHPAGADFQRLVYDRRVRFLETAEAHAITLRQAAISHPGIIQEGVLGHRVPVRAVVYVSPGIADLTIAFSSTGLNRQNIAFIVGCFAPEQEVTLKDPSDTFDAKPLLDSEIAFQIITPA